MVGIVCWNSCSSFHLPWFQHTFYYKRIFVFHYYNSEPKQLQINVYFFVHFFIGSSNVYLLFIECGHTLCSSYYDLFIYIFYFIFNMPLYSICFFFIIFIVYLFQRLWELFSSSVLL